ncbi:hypothetical protein GQ602_002086 [Ophiocordyceps camponoti-floridani]|uniref:U1 small nuclear ribonucleoprotein C n=1 Tax=Ophiocordyceps camponoti-floridani TaxID=2030778 RepID=A0A8H4Q9R5_9HYPO|nr:hypothetical protein GQ602_002086 [Ophiocordyceps camponoti-floridani]
MPKFFCDYCDVYLTHDSLSVRKAHNSGRNHLRNVVDYYQQIGHEKAQSVIDSITSSYAAEGQAHANPMLPQNQPGFHAPPPFPGFPGGPPPFGVMPPPPGHFPPGAPPAMSGPPVAACLPLPSQAQEVPQRRSHPAPLPRHAQHARHAFPPGGPAPPNPAFAPAGSPSAPGQDRR